MVHMMISLYHMKLSLYSGFRQFHNLPEQEETIEILRHNIKYIVCDIFGLIRKQVRNSIKRPNDVHEPKQILVCEIDSYKSIIQQIKRIAKRNRTQYKPHISRQNTTFS